MPWTYAPIPGTDAWGWPVCNLTPSSVIARGRS